jgi:hypothetical protein
MDLERPARPAVAPNHAHPPQNRALILFVSFC